MTQRSHGSIERIPGALFRALGVLYLQKKPEQSREALARELQKHLTRSGIEYHARTLKRQLNGSVASVPPEVQAVMRTLVLNANGLRTNRDIDVALAALGFRIPSSERQPTHVATERIVPLVHLWLLFNRGKSKRFLATRLSEHLKAQGLEIGVDPLQSILAGKRPLARREIHQALVLLLGQHGVGSEQQALAQWQKLEHEIGDYVRDRGFEASRRLLQLVGTWKLLHYEPSSRRLSLMLQQRLRDRGLIMGFHHIQEVVDGKTKRVRRAFVAIIEDWLRQDLSPGQDLGEEIDAASKKHTKQLDLCWVQAEPMAALGREWLEQNPGTTMRQLAIRIATTARRMGYRASHNSIQPILGGHKKKTRAFVYRALLRQFPERKKTLIPEAHFIRSHWVDAAFADQRAIAQKRRSDRTRNNSLRHAGSTEGQPRRDALGLYFSEIRRIQRLDRETERELAIRWRRSGDKRAAAALVEAHLPLVVGVAKRHRGYGIPFSDLIGEGNLGLLQAVKHFDPERNVRFLTYAVYWVRAHVLDYVLRNWSIVRMGHGALESKLFFRLRQERQRLDNQFHGDRPSIDAALAERFHVSEDRIQATSHRLSYGDASLDRPLHADSDWTLLDTLSASAPDPEEYAEALAHRRQIRLCLDEASRGLSARERLILNKRLLEENTDRATLRSLGERFGISRERVRQIEGKLIQKLQLALEPFATSGMAARGSDG